MHGSGRSQGLLVHLLAGAALGAVVVLVVWIFTGGRPFGEVVGTSDVSSPTPAAAAERAPSAPSADAASRLASRPPEIAGKAAPAELRFKKEKAARKPQRAARRKKARRGPVVRVVAPPAEQPAEAAPSPPPAPTAAPPQPAAPPKSGAGGGGTAKPKPSGPTLWAGEG